MVKLDIAHKNFISHLKDKGRANSTVIAYKKDIEQLVEHLFKQGVNLVHEIETGHLQEFMNKLAKEGYTPKSISRKTNSTKTFFKFLLIEGHIDDNAADQLKHPKVESKAPRILSRIEYGALRDAARSDPRTFAIIEVLLQTGVRISELSQIKVEDVTFEDPTGQLHIPKLGSHDPRTVPLNKAAQDAIKKYQEVRPSIDSEYLFITKTGKPLLIRNIRATIDRYFKAAGIENAKVNDIRHTFVAHHLSQGTNLLTVSKIAGHKRVSTTERYLEYIDKVTDEEKTELGVL
jgi:integrase/recombinase XerD